MNKLYFLIPISLVFIGVILVFEINGWPAGSSIAGILLGFSLPEVWRKTQDIFDNESWKTTRRKLMREGSINEETIIRISFAYLFRIKIGNHYLLVKNERKTGKYQPVGGVYKLRGNEKAILKNRFQVKDDNKIPIDESSRDDYRLRLENRYLRKFIRRFNSGAEREQIDNLSREFKEELVDSGILNWNEISYRFCGRHMTGLQYGEHFQNYEILLADIVELLPTAKQERELMLLMNQNSTAYRFATANDILSLGVNTEIGELGDVIADHSRKIIQENEGQLMKIPDTGNIYTVRL